MVRGNWQKRVEMAEARRNGAKERKQMTEDKKIYKVLVQKLLSNLDRHQQVLLKSSGSWVLRCWCTALHTDGPLLEEIMDDDVDLKDSRKLRASSIGSENDGPRHTRKGTPTGKRAIKKKAHPRSKGLMTENNDENDEIPALCGPHFFRGKCNMHIGKKGGCKYVHLSKQHANLASTLKSGDKELTAAESAFARATTSDDENTHAISMEMVVCWTVPLDLTVDGMCISEIVASAMAEKSVPLASIVYAVLNQTLIFDRYRKGEILSEQQFFVEVLGRGTSIQNGSIGSEAGRLVDTSHFCLPGPLLEIILSFLPDTAVAVATQVCKAWHQEIGLSPSPNLWLHLLERRRWPLPSNKSSQATTEDPGNNAYAIRDAYLGHYGVLRDVLAVKLALDAIGKRQAVEESEMCFQDFSKRKNVPSDSDTCVGVKVWSSNRILVAYKLECSLRLFETAWSSDLGERRCRELVNKRVDLLQSSKHRTSRLLAMDVGKTHIGCLCCTRADAECNADILLICISRDEFLINHASSKNSPDNSFTSVNVAESVLNHLECMRFEGRMSDERFLHEADPLDISVIPSHAISATKTGRFIVLVSLRSNFDEEPNAPLPMGSYFAFFSSDSGELETLCPAPTSWQDVQHSDGSDRVRLVLSQDVQDPSLSLIAARGDGAPTFPDLMQETLPVEMIEQRWRFRDTGHVDHLLATPSDFVTASTIEQTDGLNSVRSTRSIIFFHPREKEHEQGSLPDIMMYSNSFTIISLTAIRTEHMLMMCAQTTVTPATAEAPATAVATWIEMFAILVHVPTRCEIGRVVFAPGQHLTPGPPLIVCDGNTIGVALSHKGVALTGEDVRDVGGRADCASSPRGDSGPSRKTKKATGRQKRGKKDAFARGMTMRG
jgi:hypothetical protein